MTKRLIVVIVHQKSIDFLQKQAKNSIGNWRHVRQLYDCRVDVVVQ